jgi:hypothetical protein
VIHPVDGVLPEQWLAQAVDLLVRLIDAAGAVIVFTGASRSPVSSSPVCGTAAPNDSCRSG